MFSVEIQKFYFGYFFAVHEHAFKRREGGGKFIGYFMYAFCGESVLGSVGNFVRVDVHLQGREILKMRVDEWVGG